MKKGWPPASKGAESRQVAFQLAEAYFSQDPVTGESAVLTAHRALVELRDQLSPNPDKDEELFWRIAGGNLDFLKELICREAGCVLQERWEQDVLLKMQGPWPGSGYRPVDDGAGWLCHALSQQLGRSIRDQKSAKGVLCQDGIG